MSGSSKSFRYFVKSMTTVDGDHVVECAREDDADRRLAVVRRVGRVQRARGRVKADLALDLLAQVLRAQLQAVPGA